MTSLALVTHGFQKIVVKFDENCKCTREILFKENKARNEDLEKPKSRTILLLNVPAYCDECCTKRIFSKFGQVESVVLKKNLRTDSLGERLKTTITDFSLEDNKFFPAEKPEGFRYGFLVFKDPESLETAMRQNPNKNPIFISTKKKPVAVGMEKWVRAFRNQFPDKRKLQDNTDEFMIKYDAAIEKTEEEERAGEEEDEDGWIKVTRRGKNPVIPRTEANQLKARAKEKMRKKKRELLNSYSYQIRESKRQKIAELRKKFDEDKERVECMKQARKFRPF